MVTLEWSRLWKRQIFLFCINIWKIENYFIRYLKFKYLHLIIYINQSINEIIAIFINRII